MTLLALLRHGETDWSRQGRIQGHTDTPLNDGARAALCRLALPGFTAGWEVRSSPLLRCLQTADALALQPPRIEPRLIEMHWGDWEGQTLTQLRQRLGARMAANEARGLDFRPDGGESPREVTARLAPLLRELAQAGASTVAVCHRGVIRALFAWASGWDMLGKPPAKLDWNALHLLRLAPDGQPALAQLNCALQPRTARGPGRSPEPAP